MNRIRQGRQVYNRLTFSSLVLRFCDPTEMAPLPINDWNNQFSSLEAPKKQRQRQKEPVTTGNGIFCLAFLSK